TFVTPIDREDIHALARSLDDVMDAIDASAALIRLYRLDNVRYGARELAHIISVSTHQLRLALDALENHSGIITHAVEINRVRDEDRKSTRLNSSHRTISYAVFCLKKKKKSKHNSLANAAQYDT